MGTRDMNSPSELLPGTLDMLVLKALQRGRRHGYGIALYLKETSEDILQVGESSLYPALQRLLLNGWVTAEWGASENNRRARYYMWIPAKANTDSEGNANGNSGPKANSVRSVATLAIRLCTKCSASSSCGSYRNTKARPFGRAM
jgi:PadR family transcriptional regulator PadR